MSWNAFCRSYKLLLCLALIACLALFVVKTWHWPLVGDAPLMHYVVFLMDHGKVPYRDIVDINMPGTYFLEGSVIHLFGGGAATWRIFDLALGVVIMAGMLAIAQPYGWTAGVLGGAIFMLLHGRDGLIQLGQRDLMMTTLVLMAYAFSFHGLRNGRSNRTVILFTALSAFCVGVAATVKPTALLFGAALLILGAIELRRRGLPFRIPLADGAFCMVLPWIAALISLANHHALHAFLTVVLHLVPDHADLRRRSEAYLLFNGISSVLLPLVILWLPVACIRKSWRTWEGKALLAGVLCGLVSFYVQGKAYPYHRYPSEALLLLLINLDLVMALKGEGRWRAPARALAIGGLGWAVFMIGFGSTSHAIRLDWRNQEFDAMLQADLGKLGGNQLSGRIQCLDMAAGCINTLYRMHLVQSTGYLYDCYLLSSKQSATGQEYRRRFWAEINQRSPEIFVETSHQCDLSPMTYRYDQLNQWPELNQFLTTNYHLYADRVPPHLVQWIGEPTRPFGYRIYVRNGEM